VDSFRSKEREVHRVKDFLDTLDRKPPMSSTLKAVGVCAWQALMSIIYLGGNETNNSSFFGRVFFCINKQRKRDSMRDLIVVKFGGSSLANSNQFKKVKEIVTSDEARRFVIPSAPGRRFK